jgi:Domain of unknown function (DUF6471)
MTDRELRKRRAAIARHCAACGADARILKSNFDFRFLENGRQQCDGEADVTYAELAKRLKKHGLKETEAGITMKLKRGTFAATFLSSLSCRDGIGGSSVGGNLKPGVIRCLASYGFGGT